MTSLKHRIQTVLPKLATKGISSKAVTSSKFCSSRRTWEKELIQSMPSISIHLKNIRFWNSKYTPCWTWLHVISLTISTRIPNWILISSRAYNYWIMDEVSVITTCSTHRLFKMNILKQENFLNESTDTLWVYSIKLSSMTEMIKERSSFNLTNWEETTIRFLTIMIL